MSPAILAARSCDHERLEYEAGLTEHVIKQYNLGIIEVFFWAISNSLAPLQFKDQYTLPLCYYWPIRAMHSFLF